MFTIAFQELMDKQCVCEVTPFASLLTYLRIKVKVISLSLIFLIFVFV